MISELTFIPSQSKVPSFCKVAFNCINEARVNAHKTLRHKKLGLLLPCAEIFFFNKLILFQRKLRFL